jgi:3-methyladenine DNA glycosylase AlkD
MKDPSYIADHIRRVLLDGGSAPHSIEVQHFFKEEVKSRGWYTAELRKVAVRFRRTLLNEHGVEYLVQVANELFQGEILDEKNFAVMLLEKNTSDFTDKHFRLFESWLGRVSNWADHDALSYYLLAPMMVEKPARTARAVAWTKSKNRWARRAAAVSLIRGAREQMFLAEIKKVTAALLGDKDDMVQKGLGWLLREMAKADAKTAMPLLTSIRARAPRLVLRTACETLTGKQRERVLGNS